MAVPEAASLRCVRAIRRFTVRTVLPTNLAALEELAINLRWSWHPATRDLFAAVVVEHAAFEKAGAYRVNRLQRAARPIQILAALQRALAIDDRIQLVDFLQLESGR